MKLGGYKLHCIENAMMSCGDVRGLLLVWDMTFCSIVLCSGKEFEIHSNFFYFLDFVKMM